MSRIGNRPIDIPQGLRINVEASSVQVEGSKGKLSVNIPDGIKVEVKDNQIIVSRASDDKSIIMKHGLIRALVNNVIKGVTEGFSKELEIIGVGFKAQISAKKLVLSLGFSHPVEYQVPEGISIEMPKPTQLVVKGIDKQLVGEVAAEIRSYYEPEPYKGKGIRYVGEYVRKKAGKTVA